MAIHCLCRIILRDLILEIAERHGSCLRPFLEALRLSNHGVTCPRTLSRLRDRSSLESYMLSSRG
jgi:hypothetical protein